MLTYLDPILFPDECVVLKTNTGYIYPIFKNGSSSLFNSNFTVETDLSKCKVIDVLIRDPYERFYSGVQTFIKHLGSDLDEKTTLYFIKNYLFLNRHFCPQFFWLVNLRRFTNAKLRLRPFNEITNIVNTQHNKTKQNVDLTNIFDSKLDFYLQFDKILSEQLIGQEVYFEDIIVQLKKTYPELYEETISRAKVLCNVIG